jgi:hypothetical protein
MFAWGQGDLPPSFILEIIGNNDIQLLFLLSHLGPLELSFLRSLIDLFPSEQPGRDHDLQHDRKTLKNTPAFIPCLCFNSHESSLGKAGAQPWELSAPR